ncbi:DUF2243 domain-containing protein [Desertivirga arenae]|uniref:DUF2243 domain-containing protein n=1 Tax=Desertivirga arenae TaxID=2810309 RepID=UPI001A96C61F|nr:DUF2243 domain-containing protein [Pedobacter sp. SYSU D00823]
MKKSSLSFAAMMLVQNTWACVSCNTKLQEAIYDDSFLPNLVTMLSAFIVLGVIVFVFSYLSTKSYKLLTKKNGVLVPDPVPLSTASIVTGIGLGGFVDGIVLHQMLQWHEMISYRLPPATLLNKSVNMFWDGIFHLFCFIVVLIGIILLWKLQFRNHINKSGKLLIGGILSGWALFNLVEGIIDHQLLKLHNVREISPNPELWNISFLVAFIVMLLIGIFLIRRSSHTL